MEPRNLDDSDAPEPHLRTAIQVEGLVAQTGVSGALAAAQDPRKGRNGRDLPIRRMTVLRGADAAASGGKPG